MFLLYILISEGIRQDNRLVHCDSTDQLKMSFPSIDYAFSGYDVVQGYPLSKGRDPGFKSAIFKANYENGKSNGDCRYTLPKGIMAVPDVSCDVSFKSDIVKTTAEFHNSLSVSANLQGGGFGFEFSASASYQKSTKDLASREYVYIISKAQCTSYFSRLEVSDPPPFHAGFLELAKVLGNDQASDQQVTRDVNKFIETYGTHYLDEVTFGSSYTQEHRMESGSFDTLSNEKIGVAVQASYSGMVSVGGGLSLDSEQQEAASKFSKSVETSTVTVGSAPPSNGDALTWASVSKENPVPIRYSLKPIADLFTDKFFDSDSDINYVLVHTRLQNAPKLSCELLKSKGVALSCVNTNTLRPSEVVTISGGYPKLAVTGQNEKENTFYINGEGGCEPMCSSDKGCFGYTSVDRTASVDGSSGVCAVMVLTERFYVWHESTSQTFTLFLNKMKSDMSFLGKVPKVYDDSTDPHTKYYAYYSYLNQFDAVADGTIECRKICVRDPLCKAFRYGKCHQAAAQSEPRCAKTCYILHDIRRLTSDENAAMSVFVFVAK